MRWSKPLANPSIELKKLPFDLYRLTRQQIQQGDRPKSHTAKLRRALNRCISPLKTTHKFSKLKSFSIFQASNKTVRISNLGLRIMGFTALSRQILAASSPFCPHQVLLSNQRRDHLTHKASMQVSKTSPLLQEMLARTSRSTQMPKLRFTATCSIVPHVKCKPTRCSHHRFSRTGIGNQ